MWSCHCARGCVELIYTLFPALESAYLIYAILLRYLCEQSFGSYVWTSIVERLISYMNLVQVVPTVQSWQQLHWPTVRCVCMYLRSMVLSSAHFVLDKSVSIESMDYGQRLRVSEWSSHHSTHNRSFLGESFQPVTWYCDTNKANLQHPR